MQTFHYPDRFFTNWRRKMKKFSYFLLVLLILFLAQTSIADECVVPPVFEGTFERAKGEPFTKHATFSSVNGKATIMLYNGGVEHNKTQRVTDATIRVNGNIVFEEMMFNKQVFYIEDQVDLFDENDIEVYLEGKLGSKVTIQIFQEDLVFTTEMVQGKVFVPTQPPDQADDVTLIQFSMSGTVIYYNKWYNQGNKVLEMFTWPWWIDGNGS